MLDKSAGEAVLEFRRRWIRPGDAVLHLGDAYDTKCFRSGSVGSADQSSDPDEDLDAGTKFLQAYRPTIFCRGNHENRLWILADHPDMKVAGYARDLCKRLDKTLTDMKCRIVPYDYKAYAVLGDMKFFHGWEFGLNATQMAAEVWGNCCCGHTHRAGVAFGRRPDNPMAINVGWLGDATMALYASGKRSTLSWSNGIAWGEFDDNRTIAWLHVQPQGTKEWVLPV